MTRLVIRQRLISAYLERAGRYALLGIDHAHGAVAVVVQSAVLPSAENAKPSDRLTVTVRCVPCRSAASKMVIFQTTRIHRQQPISVRAEMRLVNTVFWSLSAMRSTTAIALRIDDDAMTGHSHDDNAQPSGER